MQLLDLMKDGAFSRALVLDRDILIGTDDGALRIRLAMAWQD